MDDVSPGEKVQTPQRVRKWNSLRAHLVIIAVIACLFGAIVNLPIVPKERLEQVKEGMTEAEVLQVMGMPWGRGTPHKVHPTYYWTWETWSGHGLIVEFSNERRVVNAFTE